ncbi:MAG: riboflavin synthase [Actinomycetota bacterium]|jgi:riboflavin synthase
MFTGIVEELGTVLAFRERRLSVKSSLVSSDSEVGSSVAVNGVCLTVVERASDCLSFELSEETLERTSLGRLSDGAAVNLERPLTLAGRLGGHLVQGHVDGLGTIERIEPDDGGATLTVRMPEALARYVVEKGSVSVDGISLTVTRTDGARFAVALIPHTLEATTLGRAETGSLVNLEVDVIAKYVEGMLRHPEGGSER